MKIGIFYFPEKRKKARFTTALAHLQKLGGLSKKFSQSH